LIERTPTVTLRAPTAAGACAESARNSPRILFVPVSGRYGMGEYARSLAIARAACQRWPSAAVHFMLNREAPYAATTAFPKTLLPSSPTFHSAAVIERLAAFRPHVVIFDNAGRTAQLRAARRAGARVVFISARARQRRRAFRWRWMALIDEHWIAYPEFVAGGLRWSEKFKLLVMRRPAVRYLDVILPAPAPAAAGPESGRPDGVGRERGSEVLVVPGGGTGHPGAAGAIGDFFEAACTIAASGRPTLFVGPAGATAGREVPLLRRCDALPPAQLIECMRSARLVVCNGGSTLLQAIACGCACVAAPIAKDQAARIRRCAEAGVAVAAAAGAAPIASAALALIRDEPVRAALAARAAALPLGDGIDIAVNALAQLLDHG
jgi:hypothetical protein